MLVHFFCHYNYVDNMYLFIPPKQSLKNTKKHILKIKNVFQSVSDFRAIRFGIDVDNY